MGIFSEFWGGIKEFFGGSSDGSSSGTGNRLYVGNLSYKVTEDDLKSYFSKCGKVRNVHLIRDRFTRRFKGYAFVEMAGDDSKKAISLNGTEFLGRKLVVSAAKTRQSTGSGPGGGNGRSNNAPRRGNTPQRWRRRRNGPRVYGQQKDANPDPIERLE